MENKDLYTLLKNDNDFRKHFLWVRKFSFKKMTWLLEDWTFMIFNKWRSVLTVKNRDVTDEEINFYEALYLLMNI